MKFWDFLNENLWEVVMVLLIFVGIAMGIFNEYNKTQQMKLKMDFCRTNPTTEFCKDLN